MKIVVLDASKIKEKKEAHEYLKEAFGFPDYYGGNLDALEDCLGEKRGVRVFIKNANEAGSYFLKVYPILLRKTKAVIIR